MNRVTASDKLLLGGALHVGVEVYGREWSYGGVSGPGIVCDLPKKHRRHHFRETIQMPQTRLNEEEVVAVIGEFLEFWPAEQYHFLHRNCCSFANAFCEVLGVGRIPAWIDRFARGAVAVEKGARTVIEGAQTVFRAIVGGPIRCAPTGSGKASTDCLHANDATGANGLHHSLIASARQAREPAEPASITRPEPCQGVTHWEGGGSFVVPVGDPHCWKQRAEFAYDVSEGIPLKAYTRESVHPMQHVPGGTRGTTSYNSMVHSKAGENSMSGRTNPLARSCAVDAFRLSSEMQAEMQTDLQALSSRQVDPLRRAHRFPAYH